LLQAARRRPEAAQRAAGQLQTAARPVVPAAWAARKLERLSKRWAARPLAAEAEQSPPKQLLVVERPAVERAAVRVLALEAPALSQRVRRAWPRREGRQAERALARAAEQRLAASA